MFVICISDYLKNLSEDSNDYKDTQGKPRAFLHCIFILWTHLMVSVEWKCCLSHMWPCHIFIHSAALALVKEVANHANDIMKQGVRANKKSGIHSVSH